MLKKMLKLFIVVLILLGVTFTIANTFSEKTSAIRKVQWWKVYDANGKLIDWGCDGDGTGCLLI